MIQNTELSTCQTTRGSPPLKKKKWDKNSNHLQHYHEIVKRRKVPNHGINIQYIIELTFDGCHHHHHYSAENKQGLKTKEWDRIFKTAFQNNKI